MGNLLPRKLAGVEIQSTVDVLANTTLSANTLTALAKAGIIEPGAFRITGAEKGAIRAQANAHIASRLKKLGCVEAGAIAAKLQKAGVVEGEAVKIAQQLERITGLDASRLEKVVGMDLPQLQRLVDFKVETTWESMLHGTGLQNVGGLMVASVKVGGGAGAAYIVLLLQNMDSRDKVEVVRVVAATGVSILKAVALLALAAAAFGWLYKTWPEPQAEAASQRAPASSPPATAKAASKSKSDKTRKGQSAAPAKTAVAAKTQPAACASSSPASKGGWRFLAGTDYFGNDIRGPTWPAPLVDLQHIRAIARAAESTRGAAAFNTIGCIKSSTEGPAASVRAWNGVPAALRGTFVRDAAVPAGWLFIPGVDSVGGDVHREGGGACYAAAEPAGLAGLAAAAKCSGACAFNTLGYLKKGVVAGERLVDWRQHAPRHGLCVRIC